MIQLSFVEDLLLFSRGDLASVVMMFDFFQEFSNVLALIVNQAKSNMYFRRVTKDIQQLIL